MTRKGNLFAAFLLLCLLLDCKTRPVDAYLKSLRVEEIPFGLNDAARSKDAKLLTQRSSGIYAISKLEQRRNFFHLFNVPYIVCFFAAKGKWPFIPPFVQVKVDSAAKTFFTHNDSYIRQFCQKWIQIKECFRPLFATVETTAEVQKISPVRATPCTCNSKYSESDNNVYFDKDAIGNADADTIMSTIEFLESFLPAPTKKTKRKYGVRGRIDEMELE